MQQMKRVRGTLYDPYGLAGKLEQALTGMLGSSASHVSQPLERADRLKSQQDNAAYAD